MQHSYPLFKHHAGTLVWLDERLVAHVKCSHHLEDWNLNWEVKRANHRHSSIGKSVRSIVLAEMVSRLLLTVSQEANAISTEVLVKIDCHIYLSFCLQVTFRWHPLDTFYKELKHFWIVHTFNHFAIDFSQHQVALSVLKRIMQSRFRARSKTDHKWLNLIDLSIRQLHHNWSVHWVNQVNRVYSRLPLSTYQVVTLVSCTEVVWVYCSKNIQMLGKTSDL